ncbi:hypothetical protein BDV10DRAFT_178911 [Aspergillus recurvatus]
MKYGGSHCSGLEPVLLAVGLASAHASLARPFQICSATMSRVSTRVRGCLGSSAATALLGSASHCSACPLLYKLSNAPLK